MGSNGMSGFTAPYAVVSPTDNGGALLVVDIVGLVVALVSIATRVYLANRETERGFGFTLYKDDVLCFIAMFFCIIEFALIWAGVKRGNGKNIDMLSPQSLIQVQKIQYAADIFYIIALWCSRASVVLLFQRLQSANKNILWHVMQGILAAWAVACIFAVALKCDLSHPWIQYNVQCNGLLPRWEAIEITGIVLEVIIFGLGSYLAYLVQMPLSSKFQMIGLFLTRSMVVIFAGLRIAHLHSWFNSSNSTYTGIAAEAYGIAEVYSSLITATTPLLKSFMFKFRVLAAKPILVNVQSSYNNHSDSEKLESNPNGNDRSGKLSNEARKARRGEKKKKKVAEGSLVGYEQWMPSGSDTKRNDSHNCGDTDVTAKTDDDRSDRTLNREREQPREVEENSDVIKFVE